MAPCLQSPPPELLQARTAKRSGGAHTQEGTGSVRFVSAAGFSKIHRFGSVRTIISRFGAVRPALFGRRVARFGLVRFGSVPHQVPAGSGINRFGSVRPVRFGFLFLPVYFCSLSLFFAQKYCIFTGSTISGSYIKGAKSPQTQATPWEFRPEGCQSVSC